MPKTYTEQPIDNHAGNEMSKDSFPFIVFGLPILIVVVITWLKYNINQTLTSRELGQLLLDLCVDTLTVGITILIAYYNLVINPANLFWNWVFLAIVVFFVIHVRSRYLKGGIRLKYILLLISLCCIFSIGVMYYLYQNVC